MAANSKETRASERSLVEALGDVQRVRDEDLARLLAGSYEESPLNQRLAALLAREARRFRKEAARELGGAKEPLCGEAFAKFAASRARRMSKTLASRKRARARSQSLNPRRKTNKPWADATGPSQESAISREGGSSQAAQDTPTGPEAESARALGACKALGALATWEAAAQGGSPADEARDQLAHVLSAGRPRNVSEMVAALQISPDKHLGSPEALSGVLHPLLEARASREENCARLVEETLLVHVVSLRAVPPRTLQSSIEGAVRARPRAVAHGLLGPFLARVLVGAHAPSASALRPQLQLVGLVLKAVHREAPDAVPQALEVGLVSPGSPANQSAPQLSTSAASILQLFVNLRPAMSEAAVASLLSLMSLRARELATGTATEDVGKEALNKFSTLVFASATKLSAQLASSAHLPDLERAVADKHLKGNMIGPARKQLAALVRKRG